MPRKGDIMAEADSHGLQAKYYPTTRSKDLIRTWLYSVPKSGYRPVKKTGNQIRLNWLLVLANHWLVIIQLPCICIDERTNPQPVTTGQNWLLKKVWTKFYLFILSALLHSLPLSWFYESEYLAFHQSAKGTGMPGCRYNKSYTLLNHQPLRC